MQLGSDTLFLAIFKAKVGRRTAVNLRAVFVKSELTLLRLKLRPIKGNGCKIKVTVKGVAVYFVFLLGRELVKKEDVRAVFNLVSFLSYFYPFFLTRVRPFHQECVLFARLFYVFELFFVSASFSLKDFKAFSLASEYVMVYVLFLICFLCLSVKRITLCVFSSRYQRLRFHIRYLCEE